MALAVKAASGALDFRFSAVQYAKSRAENSARFFYGVDGFLEFEFFG